MKDETKDNLEFKDNWAIILGGSSGLGLASAIKLASKGMNLVLIHRDRKANIPDFEVNIERMEAHNISVKTFNKDALSQQVMEEIIAQLPQNSVKLLLHSIAKGSLKPMYGRDGKPLLSVEDLTITINAMAISWYSWTQALISSNCFSKDARNIAFTSEGNERVLPNYGAVSAAKATLEALMRNMASELAKTGLRSNCIQAGITETESFKMIPGSERLATHAKNRNPFNRLTEPNDIANAVYLLCKPEASWINGTIIKVDGGESLS